ncbi:GntR family transcriptional regulator [Proteiniborus sp. MB09-C3]|uniref:GntR family transcriptional regulator n=1 Tax=Proteiniborus sp. MB09-C3 TaxID=3050072 RepID=UPI0025537817|nr:GntR family transcriptional regulator [Proteiniborus sp. MB09-C3]WIV11500.1 GntR family transcriptional regulator [Proteiniborus sp. MB09-C3]
MFITLSNTNPDPLYKQVKDQIIHAIVTGDLKKDELLPSIRTMANELKISVITIKRAYADLENEGYITTRPGLGSFVTPINKDNLRNEKISEIRINLKEILDEAAKYYIEVEDIIKILKELKEER